jgi:hypothetical protein
VRQARAGGLPDFMHSILFFKPAESTCDYNNADIRPEPVLARIFVQSQRRRTIAGVVIYAAFLIALVATFALYQVPQFSVDQVRPSATDAASQAGRYVGTVVMPRGVGGDCREVKFDNNTGTVQDVAVVACKDDGAPGTNSAGDRFNAIRNAFSK